MLRLAQVLQSMEVRRFDEARQSVSTPLQPATLPLVRAQQTAKLLAMNDHELLGLSAIKTSAAAMIGKLTAECLTMILFLDAHGPA